ncbi:MAG: AIM24 family protein [Euryarchaeota archaeon]|nr:AIM24 family protein [Euryarchaeota archaeon]
MGDLFLSSFGAISVFELKGNEFIVDTGHLVAFENNIRYTIKKVGGLKSTFLSGEGLVAKLRGHGKVLIQTRSPDTFATWMYPLLPKKN